ncbi:MAG: hypothetical protein KKB02_00155 [Alphaproteobacteria bacterium]|nr:hypothetical protein [Alphaproteobacteria bacterium]
MDIADHLTQIEDMIRSAILLLVILIILPWGAFAAAGSFPSVQSQVIASPTDDVVTQMGQDGIQKVQAPKRCRTSGLPGTSCSPYRALPATVDMSFDRAVRAIRLRTPELHLHGRDDAPPRDPPRPV